MKHNPIVFPRDELAHNNIVEWWYYNGLLESAQGHRYSYMACLFRVDNKRVKIPFLSKIPLKTIYFFHSIVCDLASGRHYTTVAPISFVSRDSFTRPFLFVNFLNDIRPVAVSGYVNCAIEEILPFAYRLKTAELDLNLVSRKPPLLDGGNGFLELHSKSTYYYSLSNLASEGILNLDGKIIPVKGKSWMDHQWADTAYTKDAWTWFSLQLDNNTEIVCFEYDDGKVKDLWAGVSHADGTQTHTQGLTLAHLGDSWQSPKTGAKYQLNWHIAIPSEEIELMVEPFVKDQEVLFGAINYWEGALRVKGNMKGKAVVGQGFMELVGRSVPGGHMKILRGILGDKTSAFYGDLKKFGNKKIF